MAPKTKAKARASLKTKFKDKYNFDYGSTLSAWDNYKKANFVYITDEEGESYWFDKRTKQRVTPAYERKIYKEVKGSHQAITNFNRIDLLGGIGKHFDRLDKGGALGIAKERATFFPEAKQGDQPLKGDKPHYTYNNKGELVVTGGIEQNRKNLALKAAQSDYNTAQERIDQIVPNKYNRALKIMGIESDSKEASDKKALPPLPDKLPPPPEPNFPSAQEIPVIPHIDRKGDQERKSNKGEVPSKSKEPQPTERWSSVFTIDPRTGKPLGVITRNQRKNFEQFYKSNENLRRIIRESPKPRNRGALKVPYTAQPIRG